MNRDNIYQEVQQHIRKKRDFYVFAIFAAAACLLLISANYFTSPHIWCLIPVMGIISMVMIRFFDLWIDIDIEKSKMIERLMMFKGYRGGEYLDLSQIKRIQEQDLDNNIKDEDFV